MTPDRNVWLCRLSYVPPALIALLFTRFKADLVHSLERTRLGGSLLPSPCLFLIQSTELWYVVAIVCLGLFVMSFRIQRLASFQTIAVGYCIFSLLLSWQLFLAIVIVSGTL